MTGISQHILLAVLYADIFDHALTPEEIRIWAPYGRHRPADVRRAIRRLVIRPGTIPETEYLVTLSGRKHLPEVRRRRGVYAKAKWEKVRAIAGVFRSIPSVTFVGVTGGLAMDNVSEDDDIDLLVMTRPGTVWTTRAIVTVLFQLMGVRRKPGDIAVTDRFCLNMFIDERACGAVGERRDFYTAHELLQMKPVFVRGHAYRHLLEANRWASSILPSAWEEAYCRTGMVEAPASSGAGALIHSLFRFIERPIRTLQRWYLTPRRTRETVEDLVIRFHPHDARSRVMGALATKARLYGIHLTTDGAAV